MAKHCGAKTRSGARCKGIAMANGRCRMHGGASTGPSDQKGNTNAQTHGFYSDALTADEKVLWHRVEIGTLDDEIRLMKIKLHRLVKLSGSAEVAELIDSAMEVAHKHDTHPKVGGFDKTEIKVKAARYGDLIIQALDAIRKLELARRELNKPDPNAPPPPMEPVTELRVTVVTPENFKAANHGESA